MRILKIIFAGVLSTKAMAGVYIEDLSRITTNPGIVIPACTCKEVWLNNGTMIPHVGDGQTVINPDGTVQGTCCNVNGCYWLFGWDNCEHPPKPKNN